MILLIAIILLFTGYAVLILYYWQSWVAIPDFIPPGNSSDQPVISVIIPARNEEENIGALLDALEKQSYPKSLTELIVVDDHSEDGTAAIVQKFERVKLIRLQEENINSYKKKAIETGIASATGSLIITTDADCLPQHDWLLSIVSFKETHHSVFIAAPVSLESSFSLLSFFQELDFMVLQGITGASVYKQVHSMCNGANLAYEKTTFYEVDGFAGIDGIASGDDMLLMHKIATRYPRGVHYLKSEKAIVSTQPMKTWTAFLNQRIRWASKARNYDDRRIFFVLLLVYLFNFSFLLLFIAGFWSPVYWIWGLGLWMAKTVVELPFVYSVAGFFKKRKQLRFFFFFQPVHILYTILSGVLGQFGKYEWKGRKVR